MRRPRELSRLHRVATDGSGKSSATIIPIAAINARPTNGWRGALSNFMYSRFSLIPPWQRKPQYACRHRMRNSIASDVSHVQLTVRRVSRSCKSAIHDADARAPSRPYFRACTIYSRNSEDVEAADSAAPLATRMRPRSLEEFVGQEHILAPGKLLRRAIEADRLPSVIFSGPPGSGKTTLARVIAEMTHAKFVRISGVESNVAEMRRVIAAATNRLRTSGQKTILFVDEIHHFNKAQQDILLPDVEAGNLRLIGATTYNPFFYVNSALVSRSQVFRLEPLSVEQLEHLIDRALADKERGLGNYNVKIDKDARRHLAKLSDGDARKCLNALEIGVLTLRRPDSATAAVIHFTLAVAEESIQQKAVVYDRAGDAHYDTISAFIKSMRASDEKGAMYWLAKMLHAGEDFRFIARRIVIFASEDVGLADPEALPLAIATQQAVEFVGMPEARIPLAHATAYMCRAPKSREAYDALERRDRKDRNGTNETRARASQEQTFPGKSRRMRSRPVDPVPDFDRIASNIAIWHGYDSAVKAELYSTCLGTSGGTYFIDPIPLVSEALDELIGSDSVAGIIITNSNHHRASAKFAESFQPRCADEPTHSRIRRRWNSKTLPMATRFPRGCARSASKGQEMVRLLCTTRPMAELHHR